MTSAADTTRKVPLTFAQAVWLAIVNELKTFWEWAIEWPLPIIGALSPGWGTALAVWSMSSPHPKASVWAIMIGVVVEVVCAIVLFTGMHIRYKAHELMADYE